MNLPLPPKKQAKSTAVYVGYTVSPAEKEVYQQWSDKLGVSLAAFLRTGVDFYVQQLEQNYNEESSTTD